MHRRYALGSSLHVARYKAWNVSRTSNTCSWYGTEYDFKWISKVVQLRNLQTKYIWHWGWGKVFIWNQNWRFYVSWHSPWCTSLNYKLWCSSTYKYKMHITKLIKFKLKMSFNSSKSSNQKVHWRTKKQESRSTSNSN